MEGCRGELARVGADLEERAEVVRKGCLVTGDGVDWRRAREIDDRGAAGGDAGCGLAVEPGTEVGAPGLRTRDAGCGEGGLEVFGA